MSWFKFATKKFLCLKIFLNSLHLSMTIKKICLKCSNTCSSCTCESQSSSEIAHLVHMSILKQFERVLQGTLLVGCVLFVENWQCLLVPAGTGRNEILQDVWDGSGLQPLTAPGRYFSNPHNMALSLSTDGVPLYKSSRVSMWPVFLVVLNLPPHIRMNASNVILCGVWVGPSKPIMNLLLDPIARYLEELSSMGIPVPQMAL